MYWKKVLNVLIVASTLAGKAQEASFDASGELTQIQALLISEADMDSVISNVLKSSYALKMYGTEVAAADEEVKMERRSWMRSLTVGVNMFGYNVLPSAENRPSTTQLSVLSNASMTLLINPFDLMGQKNRMKAARYRVARQEYIMENARRDIAIIVTQKFLDYQAALEAYILNENNLMISEELKHVADKSFKRGAISNAEYNQILSSVMQNRMNLLQSENAVLKLKFELERLMNN